MTSSYYRGAQGVILGACSTSKVWTQREHSLTLTLPLFLVLHGSLHSHYAHPRSTVYDITARDTFESLSSWINELDTFAGTGPASREVVRMIVGNKVDKVSRAGLLPCSFLAACAMCAHPYGEWLHSHIVRYAAQEFSRTVSTAEGQAFAASRDPPWMFMECSAKKGGDDVSGDDGIFGKVVDKVSSRSLRVLEAGLRYGSSRYKPTSKSDCRASPFADYRDAFAVHQDRAFDNLFLREATSGRRSTRPVPEPQRRYRQPR